MPRHGSPLMKEVHATAAGHITPAVEALALAVAAAGETVDVKVAVLLVDSCTKVGQIAVAKDKNSWLRTLLSHWSTQNLKENKLFYCYSKKMKCSKIDLTM